MAEYYIITDRIITGVFQVYTGTNYRCMDISTGIHEQVTSHLLVIFQF